MAELHGHGGVHALAAARAYGVRALFTLSGAHVFPLYDAAVHADPPLPVVDVRHEASAVFAAEATAKLTRTPGLAVLTAGPGVTNGVSAVATAHFNASPVLVIGGRAPANRWGQGSLQELDHPPLLAPITKLAATVPATDRIGAEVAAALHLAGRPRRGPVFLDVALDHLYATATAESPAAERPAADGAPAGDGAGPAADPAAVETVAETLRQARRPVLVLGGDVWMGGAEAAARRLVERLDLPTVTNGMGRGVLPAGSPWLVSRARGRAFGGADLVVVVGTPLDFRLGFGLFGGRDGAPPARVVHLMDSPESLAGHVELAGSAAGPLPGLLDALTERVLAAGPADRDARAGWLAELQGAARQAADADAEALEADRTPIHPARVYGELRRELADDAVVIGDGGDFVSVAGRYLEPAGPGCWLDPGPYGCLGTGLGYALAARLARPSAQVVALLGDGAAGFSLMDVDTLARHRLPVVLVIGNNGVWALEKGPMRMLYGYDVAADLAPGTRYDEVVKALGGDGELVRDPAEIGPALRRGFEAQVPYCVNVLTDPEAAYPRQTLGI
jgi:acetolactate synthase-1/2/3 large subunit